MIESVVLGIIQGITEWIPISSEGSTTWVGNVFFHMDLNTALGFALWLHIGTAFSAMFAFRKTLLQLARELLSDPLHPTPFLSFAIIGTAISVVFGVPVLLVLKDASGIVGAGVMLLVGVAMLGTAMLLRSTREPSSPRTAAVSETDSINVPQGGQAIRTRDRDDLTLTDSIIYGIAQGFTVIPGLSRSGTTVAALLGRRIERSEALAISFIMSIPASIGAALFAGLDGGGPGAKEGIVGAVAACLVGIVSIKALLAVANKVNFAAFVGIVGLALIVGGVVQFFF